MSLPKVLCVHLKRFAWRGNGGRTKLNARVECPLEGLDLGPYAVAGASGDGTTYDLAGMVVHHGASSSSGHYVAYGYRRELATWLEFNDERVRPVPADDVKGAAGYLLFYVQR